MFSGCGLFGCDSGDSCARDMSLQRICMPVDRASGHTRILLILVSCVTRVCAMVCMYVCVSPCDSVILLCCGCVLLCCVRDDSRGLIVLI